MRARSLMILAVALTLVATEVAAQGITVIVDRREATMEDQIGLRVTVEGSQSAQPSLPDLPDFDVYSRGQSSQVQIINGQATASTIYTYVLVPRRTGTFTIGPASVEIDGTTYSSRAFTIRVLDASAQPQDSRELFLTAKVSTTKPYVGQQVVFTWRFYRRLQVAGANLERLDFPGFLVEDLGEVREYQTVVEGQQYVVSEFRKALFPQEAGTLTIPVSVLRCQVVVRDRRRPRSLFDDFFASTSTQAKMLRSNPIELEVQALPPAPPGFSGLVGRFDVTAEISKRDLHVGESATLELTVSGTGNAQMISEPELPSLASFKVYDDKPSSSMDTSGDALSGRKSFTKALVPLEPGELTIPAIAVSYFNPTEGAYRTARTRPITLRVSPAEGREELRLTESIAPTTGKVAVKILADDILPIYRGLDAIAPPSTVTRSAPPLLAALLAPPLVYLGLVVALHRQRRFELDAGLKRRRAALRTARRCLRRIAGDDRAELARQGSRCLRTYVGDKLDMEGSALTPAEVRDSLAEHGVEDDLVERAHGLLQRLEAAQYGAAEVDGAALSTEISGLLAELDRQLRGTRS